MMYNFQRSRAFMMPSFFLFSFLVVLFLSSIPTPSRADDGWEFHRSKSGAFEVRFLRKYRQRIRTLRQSKSSVIYSNEYIAEVGDNANRNKNKLYVIKVDQTIGLPMSRHTIKKVLKIKSDEYIDGMEQSGAVLRSLADISVRGMLGQELFFTYEDKSDKMAMRVKLMYSDVSKIEQVLTGPPEAMYSYRSNDFFESLKIYDGFSQKRGKLGEDWETHTSPRKIFTVVTPPASDVFNYGAFTFMKSKGREKGEMVFRDPVLRYKVYYNVFGYKMDTPFNVQSMKSFLFRQHIARYGADFTSVDKLSLAIKKYKDKITATTTLRVPPPKTRPYSNTIYIHATFKGQYVLVQEVTGNSYMVTAPLIESLVSLAQLHPEMHERTGSPAKPAHKKEEKIVAEEKSKSGQSEDNDKE